MAEAITFAEFLTKTPVRVTCAVNNLGWQSSTAEFRVLLPEIVMHCGSESCKGDRIFEGKQIGEGKDAEAFGIWAPVIAKLEYACNNCRKFWYFFVLECEFSGSNKKYSTATKLGQIPPAGSPIPTKLINLLGSDRALVIKAHRALNEGLGIGAYAYYRRIIENQRNRIYDEIIRVAKQRPEHAAFVEDLERAKREKQFTRSVEVIRAAIPDSFLIGGHNPLTMLHDALSEGIHTDTEEECLDNAQIIRDVLTALAQRLKELSVEDQGVKNAIAKLQEKKAKKAGAPKAE